MALNAETENTTLNVKLRGDNGSECRNWEAIMMALNAETERWWLWTPNEDAMMALNTETENATLNVKLGSDDDGSERQNWEYNSERQTEEW